MAIKRRDFQKLSSTVQEFLLKLPDEETSARLRDNLLHALHFLQLYYRVLQNRDKNNDPLQWNIDHSLSPLTPFKEAPDKFEWEWLNAESQRVQRQSLQKSSMENFKSLPPLLNAIKEDDIELVKKLVKEDPLNTNCSDLFARDTLTYAVQMDRMEILKFLLKHGASTNNLASDSSTCLHRAVYNDRHEMVQLLLEHKANINAQDSFGRTPLHWSVVNENVECLKLLLRYNPNLEVKDRDGMSATMWACHLDHVDHFKLLSKIDNITKKFTSLDMNIMSQDALETDTDGKTWIHWSVRKTEPLQCLTLLLNSESAFLRDNDGKTCLHVAAEQGALPACKLILAIAGPKIINERDKKKQTPLHLATLNGHARTIKTLMDNGADANLKDTTGASSIDYVTKRNLIFCHSMIEMCIRNFERRNRMGGASSTNSLASSLNGSESNLTPAPPTTPKNNFTRSFQGLPITGGKDGRPPRPLANSNSNSNSLSMSLTRAEENDKLSKTAPGSLQHTNSTNGEIDLTKTSTIIPSPPPPNGARTRPNPRGWGSVERVQSGSLRLSRTSTRTSFASEDLDKYLNSTTNTHLDSFGGSLGNIEKILPTIPNGFANTTIANTSNAVNSKHGSQPQPQPRNSSSSSATNNQRMLSGRPFETSALNSGSCEALTTSSHQAPPPVKPRKSSSITSLNNSNDQTITPQHFNQPKTTNHFTNTSENTFKMFVANSNSSKNNVINVEDMSADELSLTSVKGEASDLSDTEIRQQHQLQMQQQHNRRQRARAKQRIATTNINTLQENQKRPTTPMDMRDQQPHHMLSQPSSHHKLIGSSNQTFPSSANGKTVKFQHIGDQQVSTRFNEWEPYNNLNPLKTSLQQSERQKSPLKSKQQSQQQLQHQSSTTSDKSASYAFNFLTDSSPRQTSGRSQVGSANYLSGKSQQQSQMSPQYPFSGSSTLGNTVNSGEMVSSSNLDLMVSGQKLGGSSRKETSPTNFLTQAATLSATPRDSSASLTSSAQHQQQRRRLRPLDKTKLEANGGLNEITNPASASNSKSNNMKAPFDRKKLEPLKVHNGGSAHSQMTDINTNRENEGVINGITNMISHFNSTNNNNNNNVDEEPSVSENTASSEKQNQSQIIQSIRVNRKKILK